MTNFTNGVNMEQRWFIEPLMWLGIFTLILTWVAIIGVTIFAIAMQQADEPVFAVVCILLAAGFSVVIGLALGNLVYGP